MSDVATKQTRGYYFNDHAGKRPRDITLENGDMVISPEDQALFDPLGHEPIRGRQELRMLIKLERDPKPFLGPTEKPDSVRAASPKDEHAILQLLLIDVAENAAHVAPPDEGAILENIQLGTRRKGGIVGVIDGPDGLPVAVTLLCTQKWWFSRAFFVQEIVSFVHPDHRRSHHAKDLQMFCRWAVDEWTRSFGYRIYLLCGVLGVNRVRAKTALYRRMHRHCGSVFLYPSPFPHDRT